MLKSPTTTLSHGVNPSLEDLRDNKDLPSSKELMAEAAMVGAEIEHSPKLGLKKRLEPNPTGEVPGGGRL